MDNKYLTDDELHAISCNFVIDNYLKQNGFELGRGFPRREYPNIIARKNGQVYGIVVVPSIFPNFVVMNDNFRIKTVQLCKKENAIALFAPVGFKVDEENVLNGQLIKRTDNMKIYFPGFIILNDEPKFKSKIELSDFVRL